MPLTKKGSKILSAMKKQYGAKKGKSVFYASANKGTIKGVHGKRMHNPQHEYGDQKSKASSPTPCYSARGALGKLSQ